MRVKFQPYNEDNSVMILVVPNHMLEQVGITQESELCAVFFEDEIRIFKPKNVKEMGEEVE